MKYSTHQTLKYIWLDFDFYQFIIFKFDLEYHGDSHGIKNRVLLGNALIWKHRARVLIDELREISGFEENNYDEAEPQPDVANVAEDVIERLEYPPGSCAAVVEVTLLVIFALSENKLTGRNKVEERDHRNLVDIGLRPASSVPLISLVFPHQVGQIHLGERFN